MNLEFKLRATKIRPVFSLNPCHTLPVVLKGGNTVIAKLMFFLNSF